MAVKEVSSITTSLWLIKVGTRENLMGHSTHYWAALLVFAGFCTAGYICGEKHTPLFKKKI